MQTMFNVAIQYNQKTKLCSFFLTRQNWNTLLIGHKLHVLKLKYSESSKFTI